MGREGGQEWWEPGRKKKGEEILRERKKKAGSEILKARLQAAREIDFSPAILRKKR